MSRSEAALLFLELLGFFFLVFKVLHPLHPGLMPPFEQGRGVNVGVSVVLVIGHLPNIKKWVTCQKAGLAGFDLPIFLFNMKSVESCLQLYFSTSIKDVPGRREGGSAQSGQSKDTCVVTVMS